MNPAFSPQIETLWKAAGAVAWGAAALRGLSLSPKTWEKVETLCPQAQSVLIGAFPYYAGMGEGNLALYCRGKDYHQVLLRRLTPLCEALGQAYPGHTFYPGVDNSPLPEKDLAQAAGVGSRGKHTLQILPLYGSFLFLGTVLTDLEISPTSPQESSPCPPNCGACEKACPTGALTSKGFHVEKCLSHLTQKKGALSPWEEEAIRQGDYIWGCDLCQLACPHNQNLPLSPIPEFRENLLLRLTQEDLEGLSNRAFRKKYGDKAFAWRGVEVLVRNLTLKNREKRKGNL